MKFKQIKDNEWFYPVMKNHHMACCDCGLVHVINFKVVDVLDKKKLTQVIKMKAKRSKAQTKKRRDELSESKRNGE
jgi:hypothetical protein